MIRLNPPTPPPHLAPAALDFVGVGAARCGTTWLARCLGEHPAIFIPARKELKYFDNDFLYDPTLRVLRRYFAEARPGQLRGELSPRYLASEKALRRLATGCPGVRILVNLRDPVDRLFSDYCYMRYNMKQEPHTTLEGALRGRSGAEYLRRSLYGGQLEMTLDLFGRERVHVIYFEEIGLWPGRLLREVFAFLGVDETFIPRASGEVVNKSGETHRAPRRSWARLAQWVAHGGNTLTRLSRPFVVPLLESGHGLIDAWALLQDRADPPRLDPATRALLIQAHFRADIERTETLLGRDLAAWKQ